MRRIRSYRGGSSLAGMVDGCIKGVDRCAARAVAVSESAAAAVMAISWTRVCCCLRRHSSGHSPEQLGGTARMMRPRHRIPAYSLMSRPLVPAGGMRDISSLMERYNAVPSGPDIASIRAAFDDLVKEAQAPSQQVDHFSGLMSEMFRSLHQQNEFLKAALSHAECKLQLAECKVQLGLQHLSRLQQMFPYQEPQGANDKMIQDSSASAISEPWDTVDESVECARCGKENECGSTCSTCRLGASVHLRDRSSPQLQEAAETARSTARTEEEDSADESQEGAPHGSGDESEEGAADGLASISLSKATRKAKKAASTAAKLASKAKECATEAKKIADHAKEVSDDRDLPAERRSVILQDAYNRAEEKVDEARSCSEKTESSRTKAIDVRNRCVANSEALEAAVGRTEEAVEKAFAALDDAGEHRDRIVTMQDAGEQGDDQLGAEDSSSEMAAELEREMEADTEVDKPEGSKRSRPCFESEAVMVGGILDYNAKLRRVDSEPRSPVSTGSAAEPSVAAPDETISEADEDAAEEPTVAPPGASTIDSDAEAAAEDDVRGQAEEPAAAASPSRTSEATEVPPAPSPKSWKFLYGSAADRSERSRAIGEARKQGISLPIVKFKPLPEGWAIAMSNGSAQNGKDFVLRIVLAKTGLESEDIFLYRSRAGVARAVLSPEGVAAFERVCQTVPVETLRELQRARANRDKPPLQLISDLREAGLRVSPESGMPLPNVEAMSEEMQKAWWRMIVDSASATECDADQQAKDRAAASAGEWHEAMIAYAAD